MNKSILVLLIILSQYLVPGILISAPSIKVGIYNNDPLIFANKEGDGEGIFAEIILILQVGCVATNYAVTAVSDYELANLAVW